MMKKVIWGNCVVKNEDQYIWFAIKSVINQLDKIIIFDTGSTDKTVGIIKSLKNEYPDKIDFEEKGLVDAAGLTRLRQEMLDKTKSDWLFLIDGDEVWWEDSIEATVKRINELGNDLYALVHPVVNLVGDIYHFQEEAAGEYRILGKKGHFNIRAINRKIPNLHVANNYPLEGFFDGDDKLIQSVEEKLEYLDYPILHFSHLQRSTSDDDNILHRDKLKTEIGETFPKGFKYPEVFNLERPKEIDNPFKKMSLGYKIKASLITPLKKIKRKFKNDNSS